MRRYFSQSRVSRYAAALFRRLIAPTILGGLAAVILVAMATCEIQVFLQFVASGRQLSDYDAMPRLILGLLAVATVLAVIWRCETHWTKAGKLDYASFRRTGWTNSRTVIVIFSLLTAVGMLSGTNLTEQCEQQLRFTLVLACGYALWCAVAYSVLWSLFSSFDPGEFQAALVPRVPISPRLLARRELMPA